MHDCANSGCRALLAASVFVLAPALPAAGVDSEHVKAIFADPSCDYSTGPLWVWNDLLTEQQIVETMRDLAGQKVRQVWVHPRPGLMTPYLSADWFRLWKVALKEAERLDMNVWIYDENSYPSGFAGGFVPEAMPESRGRGLRIQETNTPPSKPGKDIVAALRQTDQGYEDVTIQLREGEVLPKAKYALFRVNRAGSSPWYGGKFYVDLMMPGVTEKFLAITLDAYRREIGNEFGKRVPGVFTDEPHVRPAGGLPWTDGLPALFEKRWGYAVTDHLPSLFKPVGDWKRVRHNFYQLVLEQFIEHWGKPCHDYCEKHKLEFTGHYWEHSWPQCLGVTDNMAMYAWHQRPAIDCLMNQYSEDVHAQFGNDRAVRELASVANQLGRARTLCEAYGAGGWDLRFEDMKRIGDWLYVLGVNTLNEHLSYITIRGARKRDHPQSFSYHTPWWDSYHVMANYFTRLSAALSSGRQINETLVIEPTTTAWMHNTPSGGGRHLAALGKAFQQMVIALERAQAEYDIGCEDIMARHGSVSGDRLIVGQRRYHTVVVPPLTENLNAKTMDLLDGFLKGGGRVLCCGEPPALIDGRPSDRGKTAAKTSGWKQVDAEAVPAMVLKRPRDGFVIDRAKDDAGILHHHRRHLDDGQLVFLTNTSIKSPSAGTIKSRLRGVEQWDLETGEVKPYPFKASDQGVTATFDLPPCGSLLLFLSKKPRTPAPVVAKKTTTITAAGPPKIRRLQPNVLVLDYVDVTAGGQTKKDVYVYQAGQFAFKKNGMSGNPWDRSVQFRDEYITKTFPPDSGFEATYRFTIEQAVPDTLSIVIERPDLYTVTFNGKPVTAKKGDWWLDKAFGRIDVARRARVGENVISLKASPFSVYHELESAYVLGDFALKPTDKGFAIAPATPLSLGAWNEQGHPLYGAGVSYVEQFQVTRFAGRYIVSLPAWYGSVAKVVVNGRPAGHVAYPPWECDVTEQIKSATNTVEVVVVGTLKNTLGPHHGSPALGTAWPGMFQKAPTTGPPPGAKYHTVGYGLFKPFVLLSVAAADTTTGPVTAPGAKVQKLAGQFKFTEGPASDKDGNVYFTDQPNDRIMIWSVDGKLSTFMQPCGRSNGLCFDARGNLIACADEKNQLWSIAPDKTVTVLVKDYKGKLLNAPNDLWIRPDGGIYFTDPWYKRNYWKRGPTEQDGEHVYYLTPDHKTLRRVIDDLVQPNGIIGTPDGKTLYVTDIRARKTYRYRIRRDGSLTGKTLHCEMGSDGMTIDNEGNIYLTNRGVFVFDKTGRQIEHIDVPERWTANVCFGGKDRKTLFITASKGLYAVRTRVTGVGSQ